MSAISFLLMAMGLSPQSAKAEAALSDQEYALRDGKPLLLDLYLPDTPPPPKGYPLIISIHGGGWAAGNKRGDLFLLDLTKRGYAIASIDYRSSLWAQYPAQIEDVREAAHWLISHSAKLKIDPKRIGVFGPSAGGHLGLLLAFAETKKFANTSSGTFPAGTFKAVAAMYPPTDLIRIIPAHRRGRFDNLVALLLGTPISRRLEAAREGSPLSYVTRQSPPVFLVHGDRDKIVPIDQSEILQSALSKAGVKSTLVVYSKKKHGFAPNAETVRDIGDFFDRYLAPPR